MRLLLGQLDTTLRVPRVLPAIEALLRHALSEPGRIDVRGMVVDLDFTAGERKQLSQILGCTEGELPEKLDSFSKAATEEYVRMVLGQRVFTRGQDVREYRLYLLIRHVFEGQLPTEQQISALFQTTTSQSRALLRAVMSKYQYELQEAIQSSLKAALATASRSNDTEPWTLTVDSENVIEALNRRLAAKDGTLPQIVRARNTITTYEIQNSAYQKLTGK